MTDPDKLSRAIFDLIEAHQDRREPLVLDHVRAVVEQHCKSLDYHPGEITWNPAIKAGEYKIIPDLKAHLGEGIDVRAPRKEVEGEKSMKQVASDEQRHR